MKIRKATAGSVVVPDLLMTFTEKSDMDIDSFKKAVEGVDEWFVEQLKDAGYDDGQELVDLFEK